MPATIPMNETWMNSLRLSRPALAGTLALLCALLLILAARSLLADRQALADHALLIQQLQDGADRVAADAQLLLLQSQVLAGIQQVNDRNIAHYQMVGNGSMKRGLPPFAAVAGENWEPLTPAFAEFQSTVNRLLQFRMTLDRLLQGRESLQQTAEKLCLHADNIVDALEQEPASLPHLRAAYRVKSVLLTHRMHLLQPARTEQPAATLPLNDLQTDLAALSTATDAPTSPALRRTAANLNKSLAEHARQLLLVDEQQQTEQQLRQFQQRLTSQNQSLQGQLDTATGALYGPVPASAWLILLLAPALTALVLWCGLLLGRASRSARQDDDRPVPMTGLGERTSPHFINQLKTEKNQLMSDIKPMGDGILYIRADEHLESTGDLARCLNQTRESLVRRIENLRRQALLVQESVNHLPESIPATGPAIPATFDKTALIDLTLRGNTELDGLQRRLRGLTAANADEQQPLLERCLMAEQIFDEIRVRLKKDIPAAAEPATTGRTETDLSPVAQLPDQVKKLVACLEEFRTQAPKIRKELVRKELARKNLAQLEP